MYLEAGSSLCEENNNPFIEVSPVYRGLLSAYFMIYLVYQPAISTYYQVDSNWTIYFVNLFYEFLLFVPIFFYRKDYGWLHPLVFPLIFGIARKIGANPELLLGIFYPEQLSAYSEVSHVLLYSWRKHDVDYVYVWSQVINIIALLSYYLAYFYFPTFPELKINFKPPKKLVQKSLTIVLLCLVVFFVYLLSKGGVVNHLLSWSQGRFNALAGDGPVFVIVRVAPFVMLIWYAFDVKSDNNLLFWLVLITTLPLQFVLTGSRSSVIYLGTLFVLTAIWKMKKVPQLRVLFFGILAVILIGFLGNIRSSTFTGSIEFSSLLETNFLELIEDTQQEIARRGEADGYLAVVAKVPDEAGYLYGESYIGTLLFFIPRFIWEEKPRGAGALVGEHLFNKSSGAGIPPGPVGEAYWNFALIGVILIFMIYGSFHRWIALNMVNYFDQPGYFIFYIIALTLLSPTGIAMVSYIHATLPVLLIYRWMKII